MRNKNNPQSLVHTNLPSFPSSTFDRGAKVKYSLGIGGYFPIKHWDISANSHVKLKFNTKLDSFPSISPLYGTLNLRYDVFFCPYRLYVPELFNNNITQIDDIDNIKFPLLCYLGPQGITNWQLWTRYRNEDSSDISDSSGTVAAAFVPYGGVLEYLGYPQMSMMRGKYGDDNGVNQNPDTDWLHSAYVSPVFNVTSSNTYDNDIYDGSGVFVPTPYKLEEGEFSPWTFNLIPWLAYIDTYCHYIANPFDSEIPVRNMYYDVETADFVDGDDDYLTSNPYSTIPLKELQKIVPIFRETAGSQTMVDSSDFHRTYYGFKYLNVTDYLFDINNRWYPFGLGLTYTPLQSINWYGSSMDTLSVPGAMLNWANKLHNTGILPSTYKPDYFTTWIDGDDYEMTKVTVPSSVDFSVDILRRKQREWAFNMRQLMSSKRYTDYNYMQYGAELNLRDYPIYVGGDTIKFSFQDILSQANNGQATDGDNLTNRVGGTAGKAYFDSRYFGDKMKRIDFTARENGLLLVCARLVPEVDYGRGVEKFLLKTYMSDLYKPIYDAVGFQDIEAMELDAGVANPKDSIGKVPAYYEYMSSVDTVKGLFRTDGFRSWTFQRLYTRTYIEANLPGEEGLEYHQPVALPTTYIMPEQFGYNFAYNGDAGHNFGLVSDFNLKVYQPQSKQLLNTRW